MARRHSPIAIALVAAENATNAVRADLALAESKMTKVELAVFVDSNVDMFEIYCFSAFDRSSRLHELKKNSS